MMLLMSTLLLMTATFIDGRVDLIASAQDIEVGGKFILICKASAEGTITWEKDGGELDEDTVMVDQLDEVSSKLTIEKARLKDSGRYTCICEFDTGHNDKKDTIIYIYEGPTFINNKTYHEFLEGQNATIPCTVTGQPGVDVKWKRSGYDISTGEHITTLMDNSLLINGVRRDDRGTYTCEAKIRGRTITKVLDISIVINAAPKVKIQIEKRDKHFVAHPRSHVSIICLVSGEPTPHINWTSPASSNTSRYMFNSDKSELTIPSVDRSDYGEYTCIATNKIAEQSASIVLDVLVQPNVSLTRRSMEVSPGHPASVTCQASGHPGPAIMWVKKSTNEKLTSGTGRVKVKGYTLQIEDVVPSDGGIYTCTASSIAGQDSKDFNLETLPDTPAKVTATPGPCSVKLSPAEPLANGGSPITHYILEWRKEGEANWTRREIAFKGQEVSITSLKPYTLYSVRMAVQNHLGIGGFSSQRTVRTLARREPSKPLLMASESRLEHNSFSIPLKQLDSGDSPIVHFSVRYRTEGADDDWREKRFPSNSTMILLANLQYNTSYTMEVVAINSNASSRPTLFNFTIPLLVTEAKSIKSSIGKGGVVAIVVLILLVLLVAVDAACCYRNNCGVLMFIAEKLFRRNSPETKVLEEGNGDTFTIDMKSNGLNTPRGSIPKQQQPNGSQSGAHSEVTCDKAPLTKFE